MSKADVVEFTGGTMWGRGAVNTRPRDTDGMEPPMQPHPTCAYPDCQRAAFARGYCKSCYNKARREGRIAKVAGLDAAVDPRQKRRRESWRLYYYRHRGGTPRGSVIDRFWLRVEKTDDCWLWTGGLNAGGYGRYMGNRVAHRFSYELLVGPIPDGLTLDHLCRNRRCVNPSHLEPVTNVENVMRGIGFAPRNAAKTHCPQGHEYNATNTRIRPNGWRDCKICARKK